MDLNKDLQFGFGTWFARHTYHTNKLLDIACISKLRPSNIDLFKTKHNVTSSKQEDDVDCHSFNFLGLKLSHLHMHYKNDPAIYDIIPLDHIMSPCTCNHNSESIFTSEEANWKEINM